MRDAGVRWHSSGLEYELDVSEKLATIVPDQAGWFFERFDGSEK